MECFCIMKTDEKKHIHKMMCCASTDNRSFFFFFRMWRGVREQTEENRGNQKGHEEGGTHMLKRMTAMLMQYLTRKQGY